MPPTRSLPPPSPYLIHDQDPSSTRCVRADLPFRPIPIDVVLMADEKTEVAVGKLPVDLATLKAAHPDFGPLLDYINGQLPQ